MIGRMLVGSDDKKECVMGRMCVMGEEGKEFEINDGMDSGMNANDKADLG